MSFEFHTMRNLLKESDGFDLHLCTSERALIASEYHFNMPKVKVGQPFDDEATNRVINQHLMVHELAADLGLLRDLESTNDEVKKALSRIIYRYNANVQAPARNAYNAAIEENGHALNKAIITEYPSMKMGHGVFHKDIAELSKPGVLSQAGMWGDEQTSAFVSEKLLPRIRELDEKISENIAALDQQVTTKTVELPPEVPRIGAQGAMVNPVGMSIESIKAARAGENVVQLFPHKKIR